MVVDSGEVVFEGEDIGLLCADATADAAYFAHGTGGFGIFAAGAGDGEHVFVVKGTISIRFRGQAFEQAVQPVHLS